MRRQLRAAGALMVIAEKTINVYIVPRQEGALNYK
jgi:hypothetical protein